MPRKKIKLEVIVLPQASNLEEFKPLCGLEDVSVRYVKEGQRLEDPDLLILPGTKNSLRGVLYIKKNGYSEAIRRAFKNNAVIMGISGGFQILGSKIIDIKGNESGLSKCEGLSYFNIVTRIMPSEVRAFVEFRTLPDVFTDPVFCGSHPLCGYESHRGRTKYLNGSMPLFTITKRGPLKVEMSEGAVNIKRNVFGTYIHGVFNNAAFKESFLRMVREKR